MNKLSIIKVVPSIKKLSKNRKMFLVEGFSSWWGNFRREKIGQDAVEGWRNFSSDPFSLRLFMMCLIIVRNENFFEWATDDVYKYFSIHERGFSPLEKKFFL